MNLEAQFKIRNDSMLQKFIRENSHWYKIINRNSDYIENMISEMKEKYKLTTSDKINDLSDKIDLIKSFMDVLK